MSIKEAKSQKPQQNEAQKTTCSLIAYPDLFKLIKNLSDICKFNFFCNFAATIRTQKPDKGEWGGLSKTY